MSPFRSRLLWKAFFAVLLGLILWLPIFYWLTVPLVNRLAYQVEEQAARTVLQNLTEIVDQSHKDLELWRQSALEAHRRELKNVVLTVESWAGQMEAEVAAGKLTRAEARAQFLEKLRHVRYGNRDYLWAIDYDAKIISHPDASFHGRDASAFRDSQGNLVVPSMLDQARKAGDGYYSYWWKRLDAGPEVEKLGYVRDLPGWRLVIGTGVYIDDVNQEVARRKEVMVSRLRSHLRNVKLAESGYVFIFDGQAKVLVHPDARLEGIQAWKEPNPVTGNSMIADLMEASRRPDQTIFYRWDRSDDPGNFSYPKVAWVHHFPDYDWYMVASAYTEDLGRSGHYLRERLLIAFILGLVITAVIALAFIRSLTDPILRLAEVARRNVDGDLSAVNDIRRDDEIGVLARAFNNMVERLKEQIENLEWRVGERTQALSALTGELESRVEERTAAAMASEAKFRGLLEQSLAGIFVVQDGRFRYVNRRFAEIHGYADPADIVALACADQLLAPEDRERVFDADRRCLAGETRRCELSFTGRRRDGSPIAVEVSIGVIDYEGRPAIIGVALDVSERQKIQKALADHQAHLEEMVASRTAELVAANRELEAFTFATSHDLKGPLGRINTFSAMLEEQYRERLEGNGLLFLGFIRQNTTRLVQLVDDLLKHARVTQPFLELQPVDLAGLVHRVLQENASEILEAGAQVKLDLPAARVLADAQALAQVLANLLQNALKYSAAAQPPVIAIGGEAREGLVRLWIRDNGIGFDMAYHDRIFELFRRLHTYNEYEGSGVGLALVKRATERMGGRVWAASEPGQGATFFLELRAAEAAAPEKSPEPAGQA